MDGASKWLSGWKTKGWKTADKKPVKNEDLWRMLDDEMARHTIHWIWVRGHSGHAENERADALARGAIPGPRSSHAFQWRIHLYMQLRARSIRALSSLTSTYHDCEIRAAKKLFIPMAISTVTRSLPMDIPRE